MVFNELWVNGKLKKLESFSQLSTYRTIINNFRGKI